MVTKAKAIRDHFYEAYEHAKGEYSTVTARQVFYALREILNVEGINIDGYSGHFTQQILTEMFKRDPSLEDTILLDRRGTFRDPFLGTETPLGTADVRTEITNTYSNTIYQSVRTVYSLEPELRFSQALFVEKEGFNTAFAESGMLDRLDLGLISVKGYAHRAVKKLMRDFEARRIQVYVLHDCDVYGYNINTRIAEGGETFEDPLDAIDIGLTVADVRRLGKRPEIAKADRDLNGMISQWTPEERDFFQASGHTYRRVELNALTNDELIAHVESKISPHPIIPDDDTIKQSITIDEEAVLKDAVALALDDLALTDVITGRIATIDYDTIAERTVGRMKGGGHWADHVQKCVKDYLDGYKRMCAAEIIEVLLHHEI